MRATKEIDVQTAAYARGAFEARLARAVADANRSGTELSLIYIDVDDLHERNELYEKEALDSALAKLVLATSKVLDGRGPIGRLGGDEFAVFLPNINRALATALADQVRAVVSSHLHSSSNGTFSLTVSAGVACLRRGEPWGNLIEAAENACVRAKQAGRDTTVGR